LYWKKLTSRNKVQVLRQRAVFFAGAFQPTGRGNIRDSQIGVLQLERRADFSSDRGTKFSSKNAENRQFSVLLEEQSSVQELQKTGSFQFC
jgi:hypothetical protein